MAGCLESVSVIIPLREEENANEDMIKTLQSEGANIILSLENGRAKSMNMGAAKSAKKFLWFLHADTTLPKNAAQKLSQALQQKEESFHYFKLAFEENDSSPKLIKLNAWSANLRSKIFGAPYGDQGFALRKDLFFKLGGYDESAEYGEDHLLVWRARRHGMKLNLIDATLTTSARAYEYRWLGLTLLRQWLFIKQAFPQWLLLVQGK